MLSPTMLKRSTDENTGTYVYSDAARPSREGRQKRCFSRLRRASCCDAGTSDVSMRILRKLLAIALLAVLSLPFASTLLALAPGSGPQLPACCRRDGKHHCMETMAASGAALREGKGVSAPLEKCPYCPSMLTAQHSHDMLFVSSAQAVFASFGNPAAAVAQTESKRRISRDRSRQKRGPPAESPSYLS
jgi:hypothetical protein